MCRNPADASDPSSISSTLLDRVRAQRPEAWKRLVDLYGPVVYRWCRRSGLRPEDAADVVQEVFTAVALHVGEFRRERPGDSFGGWLRAITRNKIHDLYRRRQGKPQARGGTDAGQQLAQIGDPPEPSDPSVASDEGLDAWLSRRGLDLVRAEFENRTWEAFWRAAVEGQAPAHVAEDLGMSVPAVYQAKSRVLRRLRQELDEML
jgi:RNA polymerase sigma-70 factor (ECF subfamily)